MSEQGRAPFRRIGERSDALEDALGTTTAELDVTIGLPEVIKPGIIAFTYMCDVWGSGDLQPQDINFDWGGGRTATWTEGISWHAGGSPASSAPTTGFASWLNGTDLLLAYANAPIGIEGWARVPGAAPTAGMADEDDEEAILTDPSRWLKLARTISAVVAGQKLEGLTGEQF